MANQTKKSRTTIEVSQGVQARLKAYRTALQRDFNRHASNDEVISAMLSGVPLWQADAMLRADISYGKSIDSAGDPE